MKHDICQRAEQVIRAQPDRVPLLLRLLAVARNLERIANHATNIAEDVTYRIEGRIVLHGRTA